MKRAIVFALFIVFLLSTPSLAQNYGLDKNYGSISVGNFSPNDDDMEDWEDGVSVDFSYVNSFSKNFAAMMNLAIINTSYEEQDVEIDLNTVGGEFLGLLQSTETKFHPYIGGGIGIYYNTLSYKDKNLDKTDTGSAYGFVGVLGARFFINDKLFLKGQAKMYTNNQNIRIGYETKTYDMGGKVYQVGIGAKF